MSENHGQIVKAAYDIREEVWEEKWKSRAGGEKKLTLQHYTSNNTRLSFSTSKEPLRNAAE